MLLRDAHHRVGAGDDASLEGGPEAAPEWALLIPPRRVSPRIAEMSDPWKLSQVCQEKANDVIRPPGTRRDQTSHSEPTGGVNPGNDRRRDPARVNVGGIQERDDRITHGGHAAGVTPRSRARISEGLGSTVLLSGHASPMV